MVGVPEGLGRELGEGVVELADGLPPSAGKQKAAPTKATENRADLKVGPYILEGRQNGGGGGGGLTVVFGDDEHKFWGEGSGDARGFAGD